MTLLDQKKEPLMSRVKVILSDYTKASGLIKEAIKNNKPQPEVEGLERAAAAIKDQTDPMNREMGKMEMDFIKANPNAYLSAILLSQRVSGMRLEESSALFESFTSSVKESKAGKEVMTAIKKLQNGSPGALAYSFSAEDINGKMLNLADFKGKKYVLLDFWASWCVPCRAGNPHLLSLYSKYKEKGLEIVGVSDDDSNQQAWRNAVQKDGIQVWMHVLRGLKRTPQGYDKSKDISGPYGITSLPTKVLIDQQGMIVGRYGGGGQSDGDLDKKLAEIFH